MKKSRGSGGRSLLVSEIGCRKPRNWKEGGFDPSIFIEMERNFTDLEEDRVEIARKRRITEKLPSVLATSAKQAFFSFSLSLSYEKGVFAVSVFQ